MAVKAPPMMPPITTTGIISTMKDRRSSAQTAGQAKAAPVGCRPSRRAMMEHITIISPTSISPGITPARNSPPTDTDDPAMKA